jgi:uncharacterized protein involved in response to NO
MVRKRSLERELPRGRAGVILANGFRPFFLVAALYAVLGVPFWVAALAGSAPWRAPANALDWHAHEMVFGYVGAVLAGFLLTAVRKWTNRPTLEGWPLGVLVLVWLGARVLPFVPSAPPALAAAVDVSFWVGLLLACARPILGARNERNYGFIALLAAFTAAAASSHANRLGYLHGGFWEVRQCGVDLVCVAIIVVTGRIVPSFTRNATRATDIAETPRHDRMAAAAMVAVAMLDAVSAPAPWSALPAGVAGCLVVARARHWGARHTLREPLLWSLHLAHAWLGVGLVLRALASSVPSVPQSVALHAVTVGGIGLLTLSMMTRVTLGHTGRMLRAPRSMSVAFVLLSAAALLRVAGPLFAADHLLLVLAAAGGLWSAAFVVYLVVYAPALWSPRVDGEAGARR